MCVPGRSPIAAALAQRDISPRRTRRSAGVKACEESLHVNRLPPPRCSAPSAVNTLRIRLSAVAALIALAGGGTPSRADNNPVILQWFETRWETIEHRMPDWYVAGYDAVWLPPTCKASDPTSAGFDVFDRFDLGTPESPTAYGTEQGFRALTAEFHRASGLVYIDWIMNHNSGRTSNPAFIASGGWPGFVINRPGDFWGDFHDGTTQSENPGGANYNLWTGDLVGLIDIAQEENIQVIRHPVDDGDPLNITPGTIRNRPNPANRRFYPDRQLTPRTFVNPIGNQSWTVYPFNLTDPAAGDATAENATGLLMRATQWFLEDVKVDGFRLDAAKHIPQWFWNSYWDSIVYQNRVNFAGDRVTPFSFVESVAGNDLTQTYIRKDGFGFRDALDLNEAGQLRDIRGARGFGSWQNVLNSSVDRQDDGANNGTQGVHHVYSHDNGSTEASPPPLPGPDLYALPENAYVLFGPGVANIYHNSREFAAIFQQRGFWPDEGNPTALGAPDSNLTRLVRISNGYARGEFNVINNTDPVNQSLADVMVFQRRTPTGGGNYAANVLVALNDSYTSGVMQRNVQTSFPPGTRPPRTHRQTPSWTRPTRSPSSSSSAPTGACSSSCRTTGAPAGSSITAGTSCTGPPPDRHARAAEQRRRPRHRRHRAGPAGDAELPASARRAPRGDRRLPRHPPRHEQDRPERPQLGRQRPSSASTRGSATSTPTGRWTSATSAASSPATSSSSPSTARSSRTRASRTASTSRRWTHRCSMKARTTSPPSRSVTAPTAATRSTASSAPRSMSTASRPSPRSSTRARRSRAPTTPSA